MCAEVDPGNWVWKSLQEFEADRVGSVVPDVFTAYVRIDHRSLPGRRRPERQLPENTLRIVYDLLSRATTMPEVCWFCVWARKTLLPARTPYRPVPTSWSIANRGGRAGRPHLADPERPIRAHYVYRARLSDVGTLKGFPWSLTPDLWWPDDRAWCVASEADFTWTYIGGSRDLVDLLCANGVLNAVEIRPQDSIIKAGH